MKGLLQGCVHREGMVATTDDGMESSGAARSSPEPVVYARGCPIMFPRQFIRSEATATRAAAIFETVIDFSQSSRSGGVVRFRIPKRSWLQVPASAATASSSL